MARQAFEEERNLLKNTLPKDDILMLVNCIEQLIDNGEASVQIPDPKQHQKHWMELGVRDLANLLEEKYEKQEGIKIPKKNLTSY